MSFSARTHTMRPSNTRAWCAACCVGTTATDGLPREVQIKPAHHYDKITGAPCLSCFRKQEFDVSRMFLYFCCHVVMLHIAEIRT